MRIFVFIAFQLLTAACVWGVESIKVVATLPEVAEWAKTVGGERVTVKTILSRNEAPDDYTPRVKDVKALSGSRIILKMGAGLEPWLDNLVETARNDELEIVDLSLGLDLIRDKNGGTVNPYTWLDPANVAVMCENILRAFEEVDVYSRDYYKKRLDDYTAELKAAKLRAKGEALSLPNRRFVADSSKWAYFAKGLGLDLVALTGRLRTDTVASTSELAELVGFVEAEKVGVVAVESGVSSEFVELLTEKTGASIVLLKTFLPADGSQKYLQLFEANEHALVSALRTASK